MEDKNLTIEERLEKLESLVENYAKQKKRSAGLLNNSRSFIKRVFSRSNIELFLSLISIAISCAVAFYVIF